MRFTAFFAVAFAVVQAGVVTASVLGKRQNDAATACFTTDSTTCGTGIECVAAPNSVVPTLGVSSMRWNGGCVTVMLTMLRTALQVV